MRGAGRDVLYCESHNSKALPYRRASRVSLE